MSGNSAGLTRRFLEEKDKMARIWFKVTLLGILALIGLGIHIWAPGFFATLVSLSVHGNIHGTVAYLKSFGAWAMGISFVLLVIINLLGVLPNIFLLIANGFLFGLWPGIFVSWAGECVGAALGFMVARYLFRDAARAMLQKTGYKEQVEDFSSRNGFGLMLAGRALPFMPSGALTAAGAISAISFRDFILATGIGKALSVTIEVMSGHDVVSFQENMPRLIGLGMLSVLMIWGYLRYVKYCRNCD